MTGPTGATGATGVTGGSFTFTVAESTADVTANGGLNLNSITSTITQLAISRRDLNGVLLQPWYLGLWTTGAVIYLIDYANPLAYRVLTVTGFTTQATNSRTYTVSQTVNSGVAFTSGDQVSVVVIPPGATGASGTAATAAINDLYILNLMGAL